ncbi:MAG: DUF1080 domain-containing protein [Chitinophagaceae bacterium]
MQRFTFSLFIMVMASFFFSFLNPQQGKDNRLSRDERKEGWILLFDGTSLQGWRNFKNRNADSWAVQGGEIVCRETGVKGRADLITDQQFDNFELQIDWKIAPKHNSGIIYRSTEDNGASFESGPEYQLIDDLGYPDPLHDKQLSGANYDMDAPSAKVAKPAGEYNRTRLVVNKNHVEHWLNGVKVVEYELGSALWKQHKEESKWKDVAPYGQSSAGHIALQDHGGGVAFKNIKIRKL